MSLFKSIGKNLMPKELVNFKSLAPRYEFIKFCIFLCACLLIEYLVVINLDVFTFEGRPAYSFVFGFFSTSFYWFFIYALLAFISLTVRRIRDAGYSPWLILVPIVPLFIVFKKTKGSHEKE